MVKARLVEAGRPLLETFRNPGLRRLQLAWAGSIFGSWSYSVAVAVYAYRQGGASAVGLVTVVRMVPAALLSPFLATLVDRVSRRLVMVTSDLIRAGLMGIAAVAISHGGSAWVVYPVIGLTTVVGTPFQPAQVALLPALARTPAELVAANVASSTLDAVGAFAGPALGGVLLVLTSPSAVFAVNAATFVWSALLVAGIRVTEPVAAHERERPGHVLRDTAEGFGLVTRNRNLATLLGLFTVQTFVDGALGVLVVVTALELLHDGAGAVGWMNAAMGVGGLLGGGVALVLAARLRLADDLAAGLVLYGAPLLLVAAAPSLPMALAALTIHGVGNSILDISGITLLQRAVPDAALGRVLGILEGIVLGSIGVGALVAPFLIHHLGTRETLLAAGALLPVLAVVALPRLRRLDASAPVSELVDLVRRVEIFAPLPPPSLERLAGSLTVVRFPAGAMVIRKGDPGDCFYIVGEGDVEIAGSVFGPGSSFGEIALLRDIPRTADVTACTDVLLYALERDAFLAAVTQHESSGAAAAAVAAHRLGELS